MGEKIYTRAEIKKWGNSLGIIIPKETVKKAGLQVGTEIEISIKETSVKDLFGTLKKVNTKSLLQAVDKEINPGDL